MACIKSVKLNKTMRILLLTALLFSFTGIAAQDRTLQRKQQYNIGDNGLAIKGYDPVAYFIKKKAVKGSKDLAVIHQGVVYYFSSAGNRELFKKNPAAYEPQYGGWCAYAMGETNEKVTIDPETFKIIGGKLFLFYNRFFTNTLTKWNKDENNLHKKADVNWAGFYN
jgi:YHS domain-containing protein